MRRKVWHWVGIVLRLAAGVGAAWMIVAFARGWVSPRWAAAAVLMSPACAVSVPTARDTAAVRVLRMAAGPAVAIAVCLVLLAAAPSPDARGDAVEYGAQAAVYVLLWWPVSMWRAALSARFGGEDGAQADPEERVRAFETLRQMRWQRDVTADIWAGYVTALAATHQPKAAVREFERGFRRWANSPRFAEALEAAVGVAKYARGDSAGDDLLIRVVTECRGKQGALLAERMLIEHAQADT